MRAAGILVMGVCTLWAMFAQLGFAAEPLRVMTFNIRYAGAADGEDAWPKRKEMVLDTIRKFNPDLLGMQEVVDTQLVFLTEQLTEYTAIGVARDDGKKKGEATPVFYRKSRFKAVPEGSGTFWLSETPAVAGSKSWDSSLPRIATWAKLRDAKNGDSELCYLNTHWDHRGNQARLESGKLIHRWLAEHAAGLPTIVTGDMNVTEDHAGLRALTAGEGPQLVDIFRQLHPTAGEEEATFHGFSGKTRGRRIDFILAAGLRGTEATIDHTNRQGRYPSDHFPVTGVLEYGGESK